MYKYHSQNQIGPPITIANMDKVILTPRLKLVLLDAAALEHGSAMLDHMHIVRISPEANSWRYKS